jgi:hypothetical protein
MSASVINSTAATSSGTTTAVYTASVNPPRRAKRARTMAEDNSDDELLGEYSTATSPSTTRPILPRVQQQQPSSSSRSGAGAGPGSSPSVSPKASRNGGGNGHTGQSAPLSRAQRESLRKQNHSRIEKARRTKINDALAELRILVPRDVGLPLDELDEEDDEEEDDVGDDGDYGLRTGPGSGSGRGGTSGGKRQSRPKQEKEFKLEVLVRTVGYLKNLVRCVNSLEQDAAMPSPCTHCLGRDSSAEGLSRKRRRIESPDDGGEDDMEVDLDASVCETRGRSHATRPRSMSTSQSHSQSHSHSHSHSRTITPAESMRPSPSLPPISSWLPMLHYSDPSALALPERAVGSDRSAPSSTRLKPTLSVPVSITTTPRTQASKYPSPPPSDPLPPRATAAPPALALPPARSLSMLTSMSVSSERERESDAASLLLRLRAPGHGQRHSNNGHGENGHGHAMAQTSSLLGLGR